MTEEVAMSGSEAMTPAGPAATRFPAIRALARGWWLFLLRGVVGILFGLLVWLMPGLGLVAVLAFLAAWLAVDGVASLVQAARGGADLTGRHRSRTWLAIDGVLSLLLALVVLLLPGISAVALVLMVGAWAIAVGALRIVLGWRAGDWMLGLLGVLSVLAGIWMVVAPGPGLLALVWLVGLQAVMMGFLFLAFGWRLRRVAHDPHGPEVLPA
jgi:uncharacterized membrane protein HdeD (DUF308 family)